jgi:hypothetical protein
MTASNVAAREPVRPNFAQRLGDRGAGFNRRKLSDRGVEISSRVRQ